MAKVVNINIDSRREIDQELKKVCSEFTKDTIASVVEPLSAFMIKFSTKKTISDTNQDPSDNLISSELVHQTVIQFQEAADERLCYTIKKLHEYINDAKMEQILLKPVEINVMDYYKTFHQTVISENGKTIQDLEKPLVSVEEMTAYITRIINDPSARTPSPSSNSSLN